jgi:hypothetical protein
MSRSFWTWTVPGLVDTRTGSLLPTVVVPERLARANSLLTTSQTLTGDPVGPLVAGPLFALGAVPGLVSGAVIALLVLYVRLQLHNGRSTYGILLAVFAAGALVGAGSAPALMRRHGGTRLITAVLLIAAASLAGLGVTTQAALAGPLLAAFGFSSGLWAVQVTTLRQRRTLNRLLGRVTSISFTVVRTTMNPPALSRTS